MVEASILYVLFMGFMGLFFSNKNPMLGMVYLLFSSIFFTLILLIIKGSFVSLLFFLSTVSGLFILFSIFLMSSSVNFFSKSSIFSSKLVTFLFVIIFPTISFSTFSYKNWEPYIWADEQVLTSLGPQIWMYLFLILILLVSLPIIDQILKDLSSSNYPEDNENS